MSKKRIFYIGFFVVLVLSFFVVLAKVIPGFTHTNTPPISRVQPFAFLNQNGDTVTEKNMQGKVVAVNFFFTTCKGICPRMNNNMRSLYDQFKSEPDFMIVSHTCDPEIDSVARLKRYSDSMHVNPAKWVFLTGRKDSLYNMARFSYKIDDPANNRRNDTDDFLHTQFVALINKKGDVIQIYDGLKPSELHQLAGRVEKLLKE